MTAHIAHIQPSIPPHPSSIDPLITPSIPGGNSITITSAGQSHASAFTISFRSTRGSPGCVRYQWPSSIASDSAPMNAAPTSVRATATPVFPPASSAAASRPIVPMNTGTRSRIGGNSGPTGSSSRSRGASTVRSMPVIAATRSLRRSCSTRAPLTPARLRRIETASANRQLIITPTDAASRTGTTPNDSPAASDPAAKQKYTPRNNQP